MDQFPYLYQKLIKIPFELKIEDKNYRLRVEKIYEKARDFINKEGLDYLIVGNNYELVGDDGKPSDCEDMIDNHTCAIIENGKPRLKRYLMAIKKEMEHQCKGY